MVQLNSVGAELVDADQADKQLLDNKISEIDSLLKKAKLVRNIDASKFEKSSKTPSAQRKSANNFKSKKRSDNNEKTISTSSTTGDSHKSDPEFSKNKSAPSTRNPRGKNPLSTDESPPELTPLMLQLKDAVEIYKLPKELTRLDSLYCELKRNKMLCSNRLFSAPTDEENSFIKAMSGQTCGKKRGSSILTYKTAVELITNLSTRCNKLVSLLANEYDEDSCIVSSQQRYRHHLIMKRVNVMVDDIIAAYRHITGCNIVLEAAVDSHFLTSAEFLADFHSNPLVSYGCKRQAKQLLKQVYELESLKLVLMLRARSAATLLEALNDIPGGSSRDVNLKFIQAFKNTFATVAQYRNAICPAIVLND